MLKSSRWVNGCNIKVIFCATSSFGFLLADKLTSLALQPAITPELVHGRVHLKCSYSRPSAKPPLQYLVVWSRLSTPGKKEQIQRNTTPQSFSYVEMNGRNLGLGDTVMPPHVQQKKVKHSGASNPFLQSSWCFYECCSSLVILTTTAERKKKTH